MMRPLAFVVFAALSVTASACSLNLGEQTDGDSGKATFEYSDTNGCLLGCGLEKSALQGSRVTVSARSGDPNVRLTARLPDTSVGSIASQSESCSCDTSTSHSASSTSIDPSQSCSSGATKSCTIHIEIETKQPGDAKLALYDRPDEIYDSVTMHVKAADHIDIDVKEGGKLLDDGSYEVREGYKVKLGSKVRDANGDEMIFAMHGVSFDYADQSLIKPDDAVLIGSTDVEDMIAGSRTGATSVTVKATGASKVVRFVVVP